MVGRNLVVARERAERIHRRAALDGFKDAAFEHALEIGDPTIPEGVGILIGERRRNVRDAWWRLAIIRAPELLVMAGVGTPTLDDDEVAKLADTYVEQRPEIAPEPVFDPEPLLTEKLTRPPFNAEQKMIHYINGGYCGSVERFKERAAEFMQDGRHDGVRDVSGVGVVREDIVKAFENLEKFCRRLDLKFEPMRHTIFETWGGGATCMGDLKPPQYGEVFLAADHACFVVPEDYHTDGSVGWLDLEHDFEIVGEAVTDRPKSTAAFLRYVDVVKSIMEFDLKWNDCRSGIIDDTYPKLQKRAFDYLRSIPKYKKLCLEWGVDEYLNLMADDIAADDYPYDETLKQRRARMLADDRAEAAERTKAA